MPDAELFRAAQSGELDHSSGFSARCCACLRTPAPVRWSTISRGQWLLLRALPDHQVDRSLSAFDDRTRTEAVEETRLFFGEFLRHRLPIEELLNARLWLPERPPGPVLRARPAPGLDVRKGRAGRARARRIAAAGLSAHRDFAPAPDVAGEAREVGPRSVVVLGAATAAARCAADPQQDLSKATLREMLSAHRAKAECAVCHDALDPDRPSPGKL